MFRIDSRLFLGVALLSQLVIGIPTAHGQQMVTVEPYMVQLETAPKEIKAGSPSALDIFVMDSKSMDPIDKLMITASLVMPSMTGMMLDKPTVKPGSKAGHYEVKATFPHAGDYRLDLLIKNPAGKTASASLTLKIGGSSNGNEDMQGMKGMSGMAGMEGMEMKGTLGDWTAAREGSGTAWQPDSSPMFMKMLPKVGRYDLGVMGTIQSGYVDSGGKRGQRQGYANSMVMLMGRRETGRGTLGFNLMASLDPITNGKRGVPNLFQTGETLNGKPLVDRQHPHDLLAEAAISYSHPIGHDLRAFVYGGPIGEPALGNVMFMHRASGMEIPEAPISHHWFDSTHIAFGVATLGLTLADKWKLEGSLFNGHEPDENRYDVDPIALNSASGRLSYNPNNNWSFSASFGYLKSPEALEPGVDQHRLTASAAYSMPLANGDNWSTSLLYGKLIVPGKKDSNAYVLESTLYHGKDSIFGRYERVDKDELVGVPEGSYPINKVLLGDVHNVASKSGFDLGVGAYVGLYSFPSALKPFYGNPVTFGVFLRVRPSAM